MLRNIIAIACVPLSLLCNAFGYHVAEQVLGAIFLGRATAHMFVHARMPVKVRIVAFVSMFTVIMVPAWMLSQTILIGLAAVLLPLNLAWERIIVPRYS